MYYEITRNFNFLLEPNPTRDNHQFSVESTQFKHIQYIFKAIDSPACKM